ncbi:hypothetical protein KR222_004694 [Zaprionus bogoriensis]|nr:hypothetical protein KR222_004694 [Zaprionus bogoriensis]
MSSGQETYPDVEAWCRLCLSAHTDAYAIFDEDDSQLSIPMRLMACLSVEAKPTDGLPKKICADCRYLLEKSFLFRQRSQAADKKLRKHNRLVAMGKKSRVFAKAQDNDSDEDEELEFAESIEFINKLEQQRETSSQKWREKYKEEQEKELVNRLHCMREELRLEVRKELEEDVRSDVRQQLHEEVQEACRREQLTKLLGELEVFLGEKKAGLWETLPDSLDNVKQRAQTQSQLQPQPTVEAEDAEDASPPPSTALKASPEKRFTRKRARITASPVLQQKKRRSKPPATEDEYSLDSTAKAEPLSTDDGDGDNDTSPPDTAESLASLQMVGDGDVVTTENGEIYIINAAPNASTAPTSSADYQQDKNITSYNIRDNGEISFTDNKNEDMSDVMVFDLDGEVNEDQPLFELNDNVIILSNEKANNELRNSSKCKSDYVVKNPPRVKQPTAGRVSDTLKSFQCQLCPIAFGTEKSLSRHLSTHIKTLKNGTGGALKCPVCQLQLSCASSLKRHMVIHTGLKPYKCEECDLSFSQREVLKRHMDTHTGQKRHQCPHCSVCFAQKTNLQQHINRMHVEGPAQGQHKCHLCHRTFSQVSGLSRHLVMHAGVTYSCKECGRTFNDPSALKRHFQIVHKRKERHQDSATEGNGNDGDYE